jgi:O-antigen/teichoic acid export membrane protein
MNNTFLRGTYMLTIAAFVVKIFGFIYVIPFVAMLGEGKYILFEYAYKPYIILLSLATLGIPNAVAKFVSKYREKGDFHIINALLRSGIIIMLVLGTLSFLVLYSSAQFVAGWLIDPQDNSGNSIEDVVYVIKMISYSLIIVPLLALIRGFMQGFQEMAPTSISQVIEQIIRILIILLGTYIILYVLHNSPVKAVGLATLSSFISGLSALIIVFVFLYKGDYGLAKIKKSVSYKKLYKELITYAIPFIFVGVSIPLFQSIDTFMVNNILVNKGFSLGEAETSNALISLVQKIVVIPVALATAFSVSLVAYITKSYEGKRMDEVKNHINQSFKVLMFFTLPSIGAIVMISTPIFASVYGITNIESGSNLLLWYSFSPLFYSMFSITAAILQGINQQRWVVYSLLGGIVVKLLSNIPLVSSLGGVGTAVSTYIGLGFTLIIQMILIQKHVHYNWLKNFKVLKSIFIQTLVMMIILFPFGVISTTYKSYLAQACILVISSLVGGIIYLFMAYKNHTLFSVVSRSRLEKIFKRRKSISSGH